MISKVKLSIAFVLVFLLGIGAPFVYFKVYGAVFNKGFQAGQMQTMNAILSEIQSKGEIVIETPNERILLKKQVDGKGK